MTKRRTNRLSQRFESLLARLMRVSKHEIDEEESKYQQDRKAAKQIRHTPPPARKA